MPSGQVQPSTDEIGQSSGFFLRSSKLSHVRTHPGPHARYSCPVRDKTFYDSLLTHNLVMEKEIVKEHSRKVCKEEMIKCEEFEKQGLQSWIYKEGLPCYLTYHKVRFWREKGTRHKK